MSVLMRWPALWTVCCYEMSVVMRWPSASTYACVCMFVCMIYCEGLWPRCIINYFFISSTYIPVNVRYPQLETRNTSETMILFRHGWLDRQRSQILHTFLDPKRSERAQDIERRVSIFLKVRAFPKPNCHLFDIGLIKQVRTAVRPCRYERKFSPLSSTYNITLLF